jgi:hypothetical protein
MSTSFSHELTYDAPLADVAAMLADPAFREQVCDAQHALSRTVTITGTTQSGSVAVDYSQKAAGIPGFAQKIVGDTIDIAQREQWNENRAALEITIPGKPGDMKGTVTLAERDGTTVETVKVEIRVGVPLVAGKLERLIQDILVKALRKENQVGREWLAR